MSERPLLNRVISAMNSLLCMTTLPPLHLSNWEETRLKNTVTAVQRELQVNPGKSGKMAKVDDRGAREVYHDGICREEAVFSLA
jgi:hypothetical protein